jgi:uncharacterized damage-inducible protein DinB
MQMNQALLPEFDMEMAKTRKTLERVPEDKFGWKPHDKSMTMGRLTGHLAEIPMWASITIDQDNYDVAPAGGAPQQAWSSLHGGTPMFTMPKIAVLRGFVMNHTIHHRAQLGVYLRLNDVPVPSIYGPSADEQGM